MQNNTMAGGNNLIDANAVLEKLGIEAGMKVADFGCGGSAHFVLPAAEMVGEEGIVYAVDVLKSVLSGVEERVKARGYNNVKMVWTNLETYGATKIEDGSLDAGMLVNILYQTKEDGEVVREATRMIKSEGKLLVVDWKNGGASFGPPADKRVSPDELKKIVGGLGLREVETFEAGPHHFGVIFLKRFS